MTNFLEFLKQKAAPLYVVVLLASMTVAQILLSISPNNARMFGSALPLLIVFILGFNIRASFDENKDIILRDYFVAFMKTTVFLLFSLLPVILLLFIGLTKANLLKVGEGSTVPSYVYILIYTLAVPGVTYILAAYAQTLQNMGGLFEPKKTAVLLRKEYLPITLISLILFIGQSVITLVASNLLRGDIILITRINWGTLPIPYLFGSYFINYLIYKGEFKKPVE
jgi:hypothetical protein